MKSSDDIRIEDIRAGSRTALARALSLIENDRPGVARLEAALSPHCGRAHVLGITGAPGAGKSTLIGALLGEFLRRGRTVAVLAIDPSSPVSGGAVLGDRVRMEEHAADDRVFVRSVSARGHLGGLARATGRMVDLFDAAGFDVVIVETVGAGQSDVAVRAVADTAIVVCPPGLGDDLQAIKAGILEIADILVVSKCDQPAAERTVTDLTSMLTMRSRGRTVPVVRTAAGRGEGIAELVDRIEEHGAAAGRGRRRREAAEPPALAGGEVDELLAQVHAWRAAGQGVALATVVRTWGSSPRPEGSHLAVNGAGAFVGSVSGGCVEGAVVSEAQAVIVDGKPRLLEFGVSDEQAWAVGLACGGKVQVYVERVA
ncbi:MAG: methylmalonyl Co-A mutase-associated GTPase MeaB [Pseudomonadota bacterium]